jgi:hypothetical protein
LFLEIHIGDYWYKGVSSFVPQVSTTTNYLYHGTNYLYHGTNFWNFVPKTQRLGIFWYRKRNGCPEIWYQKRNGWRNGQNLKFGKENATVGHFGVCTALGHPVTVN